MKRIEQIGVALAAIGLLMKILLISGGSVVLGISLTILAIIYYPLGIFYFNSIPFGKFFKKESYHGMSALRVIGTFVGGLIFCILLIGMLFKLLQLPGSGPMLTVGLTAGLFFLIVTLIMYFKNRESSFLKNMMIRTLIILSLSGILFTIPGLTIVKAFYRNSPEYIQAFEQAAMHPDNRDLQHKAEEIRQKVD